MPISEISVDEIPPRHAAGAVLIDVREPDEYVSGHVPGALLIPLSEFVDRFGEIPPADDLLVICRSGGRSMRACEFLAEQGIPATNIMGGTLAWVESGRDVVVGDQPD